MDESWFDPIRKEGLQEESKRCNTAESEVPGQVYGGRYLYTSEKIKEGKKGIPTGIDLK